MDYCQNCGLEQEIKKWRMVVEIKGGILLNRDIVALVACSNCGAANLLTTIGKPKEIINDFTTTKIIKSQED